MRTRLLGGAGAAAIVAGVGAAAARRRADRVAAESFYELGEPVMPPPGVMSNMTMPAVLHRADTFYSVHPADGAALAAIVESRGLHPVRLADGRGLVAFVAGQHHELTCAGADGRTVVWRPYGEVAIAAFVTRRRMPALIPLLPGVPAGLSAGLFWLQIPVTTREARDAGLISGEPKFVADIDFEDDLVERRVKVAEDGREIVTLSVRPDGPVRIDRRPTRAYSVHHGLLLEEVTRRFTYERRRMGATGAHLTIGDHPVGEFLTRLGVAADPYFSSSTLANRVAVVAPRVIGRCADYAGYLGADRELGRYTIRHPGTDAIDQYAEPAERAPRLPSVDFRPPWEEAASTVLATA
jgi:hypothetical protein